MLASDVVRAWTKLYTAGLPPRDRDARRAEIESDLWEHAGSGRRASAKRAPLGGQILARCLLGVGADLSWRAQMAFAQDGQKEGIHVKERIRRDWWVPAPVAMVAIGVLVAVTHFVGDGAESWWSRTPEGWDPTSPQRAGAVLALALFFIALPVWALAVRRTHPAMTLMLLLPWILVSLTPLMWGEWSGALFLSLLGIVALVGAIANIAQHSVREDLEARTAVRG
jgi:uncharacterized membrane protein YhaH (DUF805 family)